MAKKQAAKAAPARMKVKQIRSTIGFNKNQLLAIRALGIRKMGQTVEVIDTPSTRGLVLKVRHLVTVEGQ